jgi:uncharacterized repeat protein (TIGR03803 family)
MALWPTLRIRIEGARKYPPESRGGETTQTMVKSFVGFAVVSATTVAFVGCSGQRLANPVAALPPATQSQALPAAGGYRLVYAFKGGSDGSLPEADLLEVNGKLYGTTSSGGDIKCSGGCGTIFQFDPGARYRVLHRFLGTPHDGAFPYAGVILVGGNLYGTTSLGGAAPSSNNGTVYESSLAGNESVLYSFGATGAAADPQGELVEDHDALFGTTFYGGNGGCPYGYTCGTVFMSSLTGREKVLHDFQAVGLGDGDEPYAGLTILDGKLYGTTEEGGKFIAGTVFEISVAGKESVVHSFRNSPDGAVPAAQLIAVHGELYGTTAFGGAYGLGTVFAVSPSGKERVVHSFGGSPNDGAYPSSRLIAINGTLYGTTARGGAHRCFSNGTGCGTVFAVTPSGKERLLHSFAAGKDGAIPLAGLVDGNGTLYGTTSAGGGGPCAAASFPTGCGTIFAVTP